MKVSAVLAICLLSIAFPHAKAQKPAKRWTMPSPPEGVVMEKDVAYLPVGRMEKADRKQAGPGSRSKRVEAIPYAPAITAGVWLALVPK